MRVKHDARNPVKRRVGDTAVCAMRGTDFRHRFRLVAHLSDTRASRRRCGQLYLEIMLKLDPEVVDKLSDTDATLQKLLECLATSMR